jgi:hypothetical protein
LPDTRKHRGAHPEDEKLFAPAARAGLARSVRDMSWLLTQGYADASSLKLVGDRYNLTQRQRIAVMRCACSDEARTARLSKRIDAGKLAGQTLLVDGYNVITTVETALGGGVVLRARDESFRDVASMHGTYRKVEETVPAIKLIGQLTAETRLGRCAWYLDSPVSNSGRLRSLILRVAAEQGWAWEVELTPNPDKILSEARDVAASSDSEILNRCRQWFNLAREVVERFVPEATIVDLSGEGER